MMEWSWRWNSDGEEKDRVIIASGESVGDSFKIAEAELSVFGCKQWKGVWG